MRIPLRVSYSLLLLIALGGYSQAAECKWVETAGEAMVEGITAEEARALAISRARIKAVEKVSGVNVQGSSVVKDFSLIADFIKALSAGYVLDEKIAGWESETFQEKPEDPPMVLYKVRLKSCVVPSSLGDPYFRVKGELNRPVFVSGEEAVVKAKCTRDCWLTIVNITADGEVSVLLPNRFEPFARLKAGEEYTFPHGGLALEMRNRPGCDRDTEALFLIATKERFDITSLLKKTEGVSPKEFYNAVLSLPADTKTEEILVYEIRQKQ